MLPCQHSPCHGSPDSRMQPGVRSMTCRVVTAVKVFMLIRACLECTSQVSVFDNKYIKVNPFHKTRFDKGATLPSSDASFREAGSLLWVPGFCAQCTTCGLRVGLPAVMRSMTCRIDVINVSNRPAKFESVEFRIPAARTAYKYAVEMP